MTTNLISRHLLWKDFRQVRPALIACGSILAGVMLVSFIFQMTDRRGSSMDMFQGSFVLAVLAPMLSAIACSGMLIGQERQTRTWNWSSGLPIPWSSALLSKALIWLAASIVITALLALLYGVLYVICQWAGHHRGTTYAYPDSSAIIGAMLFVSLETFVVCSLAVLVAKESLGAMVCAGAVLAGLHLIPIYRIEHWSAEYYLLSAGVTLFVSVLAIRWFRWRWTVGQSQSLSLRQQWSTGPTSASMAQNWSSASQRTAPSEWMMLLHHAGRSGFWFRAMIAAGVVLVTAAWYASQNNPVIVEPGFYVPVLTFAALLLGTSVFAGDQSGLRFRFYADRGVPWTKLLLTHVVPPLAILIALALLFSSIARPDEYGGRFAAVVISSFMAGLVGTLVSASPLMGTLLGFGGICIAATIYAFAYGQWQRWLGYQDAEPLALFGMGIALAIIIPPAVRRWLVTGKELGGKYFGVVLCWVILVPIFLSGCFSFLLVPNRPWQGYDFARTFRPAGTIPAVDDGPIRDVPQFHLSYTNERSLQDLRLVEKQAFDNFQSRFKSTDELTADARAQLWLTELEKLSEDLDSGRRVLPTSVDRLMGAMESTAVIAAWATQQRQPKLAVLAWSLNSRLLDVVEPTSVHGSYLLQAVLKSWTLRSILSSDDWKFLSEHSELSALIPRPFTREDLADQIKQSYSQSYHSMHFPVLFLPPLRWYHQRMVAWLLEQELAQLREPVAKMKNPWFSWHDLRTLELLQTYVQEQIQQYASKSQNLEPETK